MRIPRTRGAVSGLLLMVLGAWGALIPFIGPYFNVEMGSSDTWHWNTDRLWLWVIPGVVAFLGGLLTLTSAHRARAAAGAWMAITAGAWFVIGPTMSFLWNDGVSATGPALGSTGRRVVETLVMTVGLGAAIAALGAFALGRLAVRSVRDVELEREAEAAARRDRFSRAPATGTAATSADRPPATAAAAAPASGQRRTTAPTQADQPRTTTAPAAEPPRTATTPTADQPLPATPSAADRPRSTAPTSMGDQPTTVADAPTRETAAPTGTQRSGGLLGRFRRS